MDEMIRSILSRHADESTDNKLRLRFGRNDVEIKNGLAKIYQDSEEDTEKVVSILKQYFRVRETREYASAHQLRLWAAKQLQEASRFPLQASPNLL